MYQKTYGTPVEILHDFETAITRNCTIDSPNTQANSEGRKIVKSGTPIAGDKAFPLNLNQVLKPSSQPVAILMHDVDITNGPASGVAILAGEIAFANMEKDVQSLYSDQIFNALPKITFTGGATE